MEDEMNMPCSTEVKCYQVFSFIAKRRHIPFNLLGNGCIDPFNRLSNSLDLCFERMVEFVQKLIYFCCLVLCLAHRLFSGSFLGYRVHSLRLSPPRLLSHFSTQKSKELLRSCPLDGWISERSRDACFLSGERSSCTLCPGHATPLVERTWTPRTSRNSPSASACSI